jgi:predicted GNAT family acetyltransferase
MRDHAEHFGDGELRIDDDGAGSRFIATLDSEPAGFAAYERSGSTVTFTHTVVDADLEGQGIGSSLIRHALDDARSKHLTVVPQCGFVAAFIEEHPEYRELTAPASQPG